MRDEYGRQVYSDGVFCVWCDEMYPTEEDRVLVSPDGRQIAVCPACEVADQEGWQARVRIAVERREHDARAAVSRAFSTRNTWSGVAFFFVLFGTRPIAKGVFGVSLSLDAVVPWVIIGGVLAAAVTAFLLTRRIAPLERRETDARRDRGIADWHL